MISESACLPVCSQAVSHTTQLSCCLSFLHSAHICSHSPLSLAFIRTARTCLPDPEPVFPVERAREEKTHESRQLSLSLSQRTSFSETRSVALCLLLSSSLPPLLSLSLPLEPLPPFPVAIRCLQQPHPLLTCPVLHAFLFSFVLCLLCSVLTLCLLSLSLGDCRCRETVVQKYPGSVNFSHLIRGSLSPCGKYVFMGSEDGFTHVWAAETG